MITAISEMKPGEYFKIDSAEGGITKAPCTRRILAVGDKSVASDAFADKGYYFKLKMENYLGTITTPNGMVIHQFRM
ncbi:hypothetical protein D5W64_13155 [Salmonella enterica subsp. enterica serovar Saintpaul]|nr:hypothetical protein [Salmonella enterica subsp. enterica serovar Saintpaul]